jgi:mannose/fructose/N-acetylgalactosamine-specific phosphotransferase system component IID
MLPVIKELYDGEEEQCRQLERHMVFYNTHPGASALVFGADVALEESFEVETGDNLKVALMGPLAAVGDTVSAVLVNPPFQVIAASMASQGNWLSLLFSLIPDLALFLLRWPLFNYGYKQGINVINDVSGTGTLNNLQTAASILGITVVGGFVPSMLLGGVKIKNTPLPPLVNAETGEVVEKAVEWQSILDKILPYLLPVLLTAFCYWLIKSKKVSPIVVILIVTVLAFAAGAFGGVTW